MQTHNRSPLLATQPATKPKQPFFSSGPCVKNPTWSLDKLQDAAISRSHRSDIGLEKLKQVVDLTREILEIPDDYRIAIIPGSATGAIESAMWNLLGPNPVTVLNHDVFSNRWHIDVCEQLRLANTDYRVAPHGELPDVNNISDANDILVNWNGSTSGAIFNDHSWVNENRSGLVIADITSMAFTANVPWRKLDAIAFSWQKGLGGEAAHGMLVISPKAAERIKTYQPSWPLPYLFKLRSKGKLYEPIFEEKTLNTPSMLCVEDYLQGLLWGKSIGGLPELVKRSKKNFTTIDNWVQKTPWIDFLTQDLNSRSTSTICLKVVGEAFENLAEEQQTEFLLSMTRRLAEHKVAFDIKNHGGAPPSLRIWGGATVENSDIELLLPWLEWTYATSSFCS